MNRRRKTSLRFKVSLAWALAAAFILFFSGFAMITIVKMKRINDLAAHSLHLSKQISQLEPLRLYLTEKNGAPDKKNAESLLQILLEGDPFINKVVLVDQFGKIPFTILTENGEIEFEEESSTMISLPFKDLLINQKPSLVEKEWEYRVPLSFESNIPWGVMKVHWRPEATWKYFRLLKGGVVHISGIGSLLAFMIGYFLLHRTYGREQKRLTENLCLISGGDFVQRIDTQSYSRGVAEIGVNMNRILHEFEEEKKKSEILDQSLRQIERGCADYRRSLNERTNELERIRREMRESMIHLFEMLWCGIIIIDDQYKIHYINEQAERLLRFARLEDSNLSDEKIKNCLSPLIRHGSVDVVDDMCVWPQPSLGQSVSCHIRASRIPTGTADRLYYLLLRDEGGYPKRHNSAYFSERLLLDYLVHDSSLNDSSSSDELESRLILKEDRFRTCLRRLETFHALEKGEIGPVASIRLSTWLRNHFDEDNYFSQYVQLDANALELDTSIRTPECIIREMIDSMMILIWKLIQANRSNLDQVMVLRASVDSSGKPMITLTLPGLMKRDSIHIHDLLNERMPAHLSDELSDASLENLEMDICYSLFRCVKQLLRAHIVCVYSESKKMAMVRMIIENHSISNVKEDMDVPAAQITANRDLIHQFLSPL
ncbi:MAG: hypothetical protein JXR73_16570 [Candidatus Omnitrophica bacterium]|nr:hypothetical protein [Candidatus Omnitrophota bacterium]